MSVGALQAQRFSFFVKRANRPSRSGLKHVAHCCCAFAIRRSPTPVLKLACGPKMWMKRPKGMPPSSAQSIGKMPVGTRATSTWNSDARVIRTPCSLGSCSFWIAASLRNCARRLFSSAVTVAFFVAI